jgi:hypothetical protein
MILSRYRLDDVVDSFSARAVGVAADTPGTCGLWLTFGADGGAFGILMVRPGSDGLALRPDEAEEDVPKILFCNFLADIAWIDGCISEREFHVAAQATRSERVW